MRFGIASLYKHPKPAGARPLLAVVATAYERPKAELLQGTLDMLILGAVSLGPLYGYGIIHRMAQMSDEMLNVEQGLLYPVRYRMAQRGW